MKTIAFTGGGTLGHVMPNLYLINELKLSYNCIYIGSNGIESEKLKPLLQKNFYEIPTVKLIRGKIITNLKIPFVLIKSIINAKKILKKCKPSVVFSKGGYVALPVCIAAKMLKIPVIAHESDFSFGLANKIILSLCKKMCVNFKTLESKNKKIIYTGPIFDKSFDSDIPPKHNFNLNPNLPTILIVGGSLGSKFINQLIINNINKLITDFNIIHLTGKGNLEKPSYKNYNSLECFEDMPHLYNLADFIISRSGAGVSAEAFYKKLPMLLIPLENSSSRGDQLENATYYQNLKVAQILHEKQLDNNNFSLIVKNFYKNINDFKLAYKSLKQINGKEKTIELITEFAK